MSRNLLFLTQRVDSNDAVLGFVTRWLQGLASHFERVRAIALDAGDLGDLPSSVEVRTVGRRGSVLRYLRYKGLLRRALLSEGFDTVLAHMVPRYSLLAAPIARRAGARQFLWYTHGTVDRRLVRAVEQDERVFTASDESMRLETEKRLVTGHGIDLEHFAVGEAPEQPPRLLSVGRLSPRKDPLTLIEALRLLVDGGRDLSLDWVGDVLAPGDRDYSERVRARIAESGLEDRVTLHGAVPYPLIPEFFGRCTLLLSASLTGSVDKVVLEAMACGRPVLTCNESFGSVLGSLGEEAGALRFPEGDPRALADRIDALLSRSAGERAALGGRLREIVAAEHEVDRLMGTLAREMGAHS